MELISGGELHRRLAADPPLLAGLPDPGIQVQMNGVDLTLAEVGRFAGGPGLVDFDNASRRIPSPEVVHPGPDGLFRLPPGAFWVRYNEVVSIPADVFAIGRTRSSLLRSGAHVGTALWDSGYCGRSGSLLTVHHPKGLELTRNARIVQLVFFHLVQPADQTYRGIFQNE